MAVQEAAAEQLVNIAVSVGKKGSRITGIALLAALKVTFGIGKGSLSLSKAYITRIKREKPH